MTGWEGAVRLQVWRRLKGPHKGCRETYEEAAVYGEDVERLKEQRAAGRLARKRNRVHRGYKSCREM